MRLRQAGPYCPAFQGHALSGFIQGDLNKEASKSQSCKVLLLIELTGELLCKDEWIMQSDK